jgi:hypothetical protein
VESKTTTPLVIKFQHVCCISWDASAIIEIYHQTNANPVSSPAKIRFRAGEGIAVHQRQWRGSTGVGLRSRR